MMIICEHDVFYEYVKVKSLIIWYYFYCPTRICVTLLLLLLSPPPASSQKTKKAIGLFKKSCPHYHILFDIYGRD